MNQKRGRKEGEGAVEMVGAVVRGVGGGGGDGGDVCEDEDEDEGRRGRRRRTRRRKGALRWRTAESGTGSVPERLSLLKLALGSLLSFLPTGREAREAIPGLAIPGPVAHHHHIILLSLLLIVLPNNAFQNRLPLPLSHTLLAHTYRPGPFIPIRRFSFDSQRNTSLVSHLPRSAF